MLSNVTRRFASITAVATMIVLVNACSGGSTGTSVAGGVEPTAPAPVGSGGPSAAPSDRGAGTQLSCPSPLEACGMECVNTRSAVGHCGECGKGCAQGEICSSGSCVNVDIPCPSEGCPKGSYCELSSTRCVAGCLADAGCVEGDICEARKCITGCRTDDACGAGNICEGQKCRPGCRQDVACGDGNICENLTCRSGCRKDAQCGDGKICDGLECKIGCRTDEACGVGNVCVDRTCRAGCREDPPCGPGKICENLACRPGCRDTSTCANGSYCRATTMACETCADVNESASAVLLDIFKGTGVVKDGVLCAGRDTDEFNLVFHTGVASPGFDYRVEIVDAPADAVTTVTATFPGLFGRTETKTGTGLAFAYGDGESECSPAWACADNTDDHSVVISTTANAPIKYRVSGSFR